LSACSEGSPKTGGRSSAPKARAISSIDAERGLAAGGAPRVDDGEAAWPSAGEA
jgi:hypothetical protein